MQALTLRTAAITKMLGGKADFGGNCPLPCPNVEPTLTISKIHEILCTF